MSKKNFIGAIDQGTTSTRFIIFDKQGNIVSSAQLEHQQIYPQAGWVEHDAEEIWKNTQKVIKMALENGNIEKGQIAAIGITNQRETTVIWNKKTGKPYANAIVWQDTRTDGICRQFETDVFRAKTGLPMSTYFSATKIKWMMDNTEGLKKAAKNGEVLFGTIDTWLIWNLTGGSHVTDVTNASRTMLMDLETLEWDDEILEAMDIPRNILPQIRPSSDPEFYGYTLANGPFGEKIPLAGDLGDQQASLFGQCCYEQGMAKNTYGTGCFMLMNIGTNPVMSDYGLLTTLGYKIGKESAVYALEGSVAITGALVQWLRDNLEMISGSDDVEILASSVNDNGGIYFVPAFSGLFAPYWKNDARGAIVGLTRYINKGHIARAVLEATALQSKEIFDAMIKDSRIKIKALKVDGGMVRNELLMQFQSDILNIPVIKPYIVETTALGAAYAAGLAVGFWKDCDELKRNWKQDKEWWPDMDEYVRNKIYKDWLKAVQRTFDWIEP